MGEYNVFSIVKAIKRQTRDWDYHFFNYNKVTYFRLVYWWIKTAKYCKNNVKASYNFLI